MKPSEAMRIGAAIRPQAYGAYFDYSDTDDGTTIMRSCAVGAMLEVIAGDDGIAAVFEQKFNLDDYREALGITSWDVDVEHPVTHDQTPLIVVITHLNDADKWTREQIADWLESIGY